jgi:hypothetical protein
MRHRRRATGDAGGDSPAEKPERAADGTLTFVIVGAGLRATSPFVPVASSPSGESAWLIGRQDRGRDVRLAKGVAIVPADLTDRTDFDNANRGLVSRLEPG